MLHLFVKVLLVAVGPGRLGPVRLMSPDSVTTQLTKNLHLLVVQKLRVDLRVSFQVHCGEGRSTGGGNSNEHETGARSFQSDVANFLLEHWMEHLHRTGDGVGIRPSLGSYSNPTGPSVADLRNLSFGDIGLGDIHPYSEIVHFVGVSRSVHIRHTDLLDQVPVDHVIPTHPAVLVVDILVVGRIRDTLVDFGVDLDLAFPSLHSGYPNPAEVHQAKTSRKRTVSHK